jgi:uroporphyrinogen-III synthase
VLLHSPRAAALFAELADAAGVSRATVRIAAISPAVLAAAGAGWAAGIAASSPDDDALLAAAARMCE